MQNNSQGHDHRNYFMKCDVNHTLISAVKKAAHQPLNLSWHLLDISIQQ